MTDLIKRLRMLAPPNPVARLVLTEDDWPAIAKLLETLDAAREIIGDDEP